MAEPRDEEERSDVTEFKITKSTGRDDSWKSSGLVN